MKRVIQSVVLIAVLLSGSPVLAQYGNDPYIEGYAGGNFTLPMGFIKNDLTPDSLNATAGIGYDLGLGYYVMKPNLVVGLYFNLRNMGTEELELNHRVYETGLYGKYFISDITEKAFSPYLKASAGLNFSKLVTRVQGETGPVFRELSLDPALGVGIGLGLHYKTNDFGALYVEGAYNYDFTSGVSGQFKDVDYVWGDNNQYVVVKAGIIFNIGPKE